MGWRNVLCSLVLLVAAVPSAYGSSSEAAAGIFKEKPITRAQILEKRPGKKQVIQVWASWCTSCNKALDRVENYLRKRGDVDLFTITVDEDPAAAQGYIIKHHDLFVQRSIPVLRDPNAILLRTLQLKSVPATMIIAEDGSITVEHGHPTNAWIEKSLGKASL